MGLYNVISLNRNLRMNQELHITELAALAEAHGINHIIAGEQLLCKDVFVIINTRTPRIAWVNVSAWPVDRFIKWLGY